MAPEIIMPVDMVSSVFPSQSAPRGCTEDEGGPLEAGLQEQASNHLKLRW
jgi:hypothetical protein